MTISLLAPTPDTSAKLEPAPRNDNPIRMRVRRALMNAQSPLVHDERRQERRFPYPYPIRLTPLAKDGRVLNEEEFWVLGKHLSEMGLDFYHRQPVAFRRVVVALDCGEENWIAFLLDLSWCRFGGRAWYENGGRFLRPLKPPCRDSVQRVQDLAIR